MDYVRESERTCVEEVLNLLEDEGSASCEGKDNHEAWIRNTVSEGLKNNRVPALADLDTGAEFQEFYRSWVAYLEENYGTDADERQE